MTDFEKEEQSKVSRGKPRTKMNGKHPPNGVQIEADGSIFLIWENFKLACSRSGPYVNVDNVVKILTSHPSLIAQIWYDEFHDRMYSTLWSDSPIEWADHHDVELTAWIQRELQIPKMAKTVVRDAVDYVSRIDVRNEPKEWMDNLRWDGTERLITLMADGFGAQQNDYTADVGRCWFTSMVARIFQPGAKVDYMPVFEGIQGLSKSSALDAIGGKWFAESHEDITSKDFRQTLRGKMLVEFSELHAFKRADIERIKGMITCRIDRYRESYGRHAKDYPRRCVFAGTTNRDDWVQDDTGARRFWPIKCGEINIPYLRSTRDQLFAEAVVHYKNGRPWWDINPEMARLEQDKRRDIDEWANYILPWCSAREYVNVGEILSNVLELEPERQGRSEQMRVASILRGNGFIKEDKWVLGRVLKIWRTPDNLKPSKGSEQRPLDY